MVKINFNSLINCLYVGICASVIYRFIVNLMLYYLGHPFYPIMVNVRG